MVRVTQITMRPILLGSRAAGTEQSDSDVDVITASKKAVKINKNTDTPLKVDFFERDYDLELYYHLNKLYDENNESLRTRVINGIEFILPTKEMLAMIYLSSLIRVVPYTQDQDLNIQIWLKRMRTYNRLREEIDYAGFDKQLEDEKSFLHKQYHARVDDKFYMYDDTPISLEQTEDAFFKDNVKRRFDHDYLHGEVAELNRGERSLIFEKYKKEGVAGLDPGLFAAGELKEKITMAQEEIIVLMLERKIIPSLELEKKYVLDNFDQDMNSISTHFATNLCGQGYYFLRKWVIDHFILIMKILPTREDIVSLGYRLMNLCPGDELKPESFPGFSNETLAIYKRLREHFERDVIDRKHRDRNESLVLGGDNLGLGTDSDGKRFFLTISIIDDKLCIFKQHFIEQEVPKKVMGGHILNEQLTVTNRRDVVKDPLERKQSRHGHSLNAYKITVRHSGYYDSVAACTGYSSRSCDSEEEEIEISRKHSSDNIRVVFPDGTLSDDYDKTSSSESIRYYINSFGSIKNYAICEEIARFLLAEAKKINEFKIS